MISVKYIEIQQEEKKKKKYNKKMRKKKRWIAKLSFSDVCLFIVLFF